MDKTKQEILKLAYEEHKSLKQHYDKMMNYYKGESDVMIDKESKIVTPNSKLRISTNFIKNFIDEEVSYSVGNDVKYISKDGNEEIVNDIEKYFSKLSHAHDINLLEKMLINSISYELYYIDRDGDFNAKVVPASSGYLVTDNFGDIEFFMHFYKKKFDDEEYIDVYDHEFVEHYNSSFEIVGPKTPHWFSEVPVGVATYNIDEDTRHKTIFNTIKGLQDAYETNLTDIANEVSAFRNAYMLMKGAQIDEGDIKEMKEMGILQVPSGDGDIQWLIKNINDVFIQNTLTTEEQKMYQLTKHTNHNESMDITASGIALQTRLMGLREKCKLNQKALGDCIRKRLKMLFDYVEVLKNKEYEYNDIRIVFSANLPSDDLTTAKIINLLGDKISTETALENISIVENVQEEIDKIKREQEELYGGGLDFYYDEEE